MPQLDALRAIAILLVLISHFVPRSNEFVDFGQIGVRLFFVLSGFLITSILLQSKTLTAAGEQPVSIALWRFYIRRSLRIFPLFYLVVFIALFSGLYPALSSTLIWHVAYGSNFYFFIHSRWLWPVSHFWSLAVEEQFYLGWPWLVLFIPRKFLMWTVVLMIATGPAFRVVGSLAGANSEFIKLLPLSCLDTLGAGALLALFSENSIEKDAVLLFRKIALLVGGPLFICVQVARYFNVAQAFQLMAFDISVASVSVWLVSRAAAGFSGIAGRLLEMRTILYIGTISYGIYIFHNFIPAFVRPLIDPICRQLGVTQYPSIPIFVMSSVVTVVIASISWHFYERPINSLKRHFGR